MEQRSILTHNKLSLLTESSLEGGDLTLWNLFSCNISSSKDETPARSP